MTPMRRRLIALCSVIDKARETSHRLEQGRTKLLTPAQMRERVRRLLREAQSEIPLILEDIDLEDKLS